MRIVITGASGNVGTALLRALQRTEDHELVGIARRRPEAIAPYTEATWHQIDVGEPDAQDALVQVCRGADVVVHLAWAVQPRRNRPLLWRTNVQGSAAVANAAIAGDVPHLVHMSSVGAYSKAPRERWVDESWPVEGIATSAYSVDKAAAERNLDRYRRAISVARIRPSLILQSQAAAEVSRYFMGPLVPTWLASPKLVRFAPWPSGMVLQFTHADDIADAVVRVIERRATGAFNLAAGPPVDREAMKSIVGGIGPILPAGLFKAVAAATWRLHLQPTDPGWLDLAFHSPLLRSDRARTELEWEPRHDGLSVLRSFLPALAEGVGAGGPLLAPRG